MLPSHWPVFLSEDFWKYLRLRQDNRNMSKEVKSTPMKCVSWLTPKASGFLVLTLKSPFLVPLTDPRKGIVKLQLTLLHAYFQYCILHVSPPGKQVSKMRVKSKLSLCNYPKQDTFFFLSKQGSLSLVMRESWCVLGWGLFDYRILFQLWALGSQLLWPQLLSTAIKRTPRQNNEGGAYAPTCMGVHMYLLYLRRRKTGYWGIRGVATSA